MKIHGDLPQIAGHTKRTITESFKVSLWSTSELLRKEKAFMRKISNAQKRAEYLFVFFQHKKRKFYVQGIDSIQTYNSSKAVEVQPYHAKYISLRASLTSDIWVGKYVELVLAKLLLLSLQTLLGLVSPYSFCCANWKKSVNFNCFGSEMWADKSVEF